MCLILEFFALVISWTCRAAEESGRRCALGVGVFVVAGAVGPCVIAQVNTATISGVLADSSGAVIPGVKIAVTNASTKVVREGLTDGAGRFEVPQLNPGSYSVSVVVPGFETYTRDSIMLEVGQQIQLPIKLTPGSTAVQIMVTDAAPQVNASTSLVADVVDQQSIENLPLNGRDFSQLPEANVIIPRCGRDQHATILRKRHLIQPACLPIQGSTLFTCRDAPETDHPVIAR